MIAFIKGKIIRKEPSFLDVDVNGIGYHVIISLLTYADVKNQNEVFLHTHLHIREDAHILYGFSNEFEKRNFQYLVSVNGVGPGTAMIILSSLSAEDLRRAVLSEDLATLQGVKGIGSKTAQRIIIELKDKFRKDSSEEILSSVPAAHNTLRLEALSALVTLGIAKNAAEKSIDVILKKSGNTLTLEDLVRQALKNN